MSANAHPTPHPCLGCGKRVAYRRVHQRKVGAGKARVAHKCGHGTPCIFGSRFGGQGFNWPTCKLCRADRVAEGQR